jgi:hypothetical protein
MQCSSQPMFPKIVTAEMAERPANGMMKPPSVDLMDATKWRGVMESDKCSADVSRCPLVKLPDLRALSTCSF